MSFDDQIRKAFDGALRGVREHIEADLRTFAQDLARATAEERSRAVKEAADAAAAEVRRQAHSQLAQLRDAAQKHTDELRRSAESQIRAAEAQIAELKRALDQARHTAEKQLAEARRTAGEQLAEAGRTAEEQLADARRTAEEQLVETRHTAEEQLAEVRRDAGEQLTDARRNAEKELAGARRGAQAEIDEVRRTADEKLEEFKKAADQRVVELTHVITSIRKSAAAEAEAVLVAQLAAAAAANERKIADAVEGARTDSHQVVLAQAARFADAIQALDEARSLGEVLDTLAECAGREVDRAAVLLVKGDRLNGWRLAGFGASVPPAKSIDLSFDEAGLPGAVVRTGVAVSRPAVEPAHSRERQPALPPFAHDAGARHALALPVTVGGSVVAVLYADAPRLDTPSASSRWPAVLDVLARHASRTLEAMTVQQAAGLPLPRPVARGSPGSLPGPIEQAASGADEDAARRYARLLLSEIRMYNEPVVDAGRRSHDLLERLSGEIARARRLYEARVPPSVSARSEYFEQELVRTLADGDRSLLGSIR